MSTIYRVACTHLHETDVWCDEPTAKHPCAKVVLASDHDATVAELRAELERMRGELSLLRQCAEDWKDMPCETRGLEDMEAGCCRACRARIALKATEPKAIQETYLGEPWPRIITPKEPV